MTDVISARETDDYSVHEVSLPGTTVRWWRLADVLPLVFNHAEPR